MKRNKIERLVFTSINNTRNTTFIKCTFLHLSHISLFENLVLENCTFIDCIFENIYMMNYILKGDICFKNCTFKGTSVYRYDQYCKELKNIEFINCTLDVNIDIPIDKIKFIDCINTPKMYTNDKPFYGYKYSNEGYLIILEIPKGAVVFEYDNKCRTNIAKVISILNTNGTYSGIKECRSWYDECFKYRLGEYVYEKLSNYCTPCHYGIHFFRSTEKAYEFYRLNIREDDLDVF